MLSGKFVIGAVVGATAMYYFDPDRGHARRARGRDQALAKARRVRREGERRARYQAGRRRGEMLVEHGAGRFHPVDDRAVATHLKQIVATLDLPTGDVIVDFVDGTLSLRGQVGEASHIERIVHALEHEPGVTTVECYLHLPGQPAPNKEAALAATERLRGLA
jgi:BON domain